MNLMNGDTELFFWSAISCSSKLLLPAALAACVITSGSSVGMVSSTNAVTSLPFRFCISVESCGSSIGQRPGEEPQDSPAGTGIGGTVGQPCVTSPVAPPTQLGMAATMGTFPSSL